MAIEAPEPIDEATIRAFAAGLRGALIRPGDPDYDVAHKAYHAMIDRIPAAVARCADVADVIQAMNFARDHGLRVAVRGYGAACASPVDPERARAGAEPVPADLTRREREVAALLARGYTNRQVAEALVITEGSAHLHVVRLLRKLGFHTRARAAVWAVTHQVASGAAP